MKEVDKATCFSWCHLAFHGVTLPFVVASCLSHGGTRQWDLASLKYKCGSEEVNAKVAMDPSNYSAMQRWPLCYAKVATLLCKGGHSAMQRWPLCYAKVATLLCKGGHSAMQRWPLCYGTHLMVPPRLRRLSLKGAWSVSRDSLVVGSIVFAAVFSR